MKLTFKEEAFLLVRFAALVCIMPALAAIVGLIGYIFCAWFFKDQELPHTVMTSIKVIALLYTAVFIAGFIVMEMWQERLEKRAITGL